MGEVPSPSEWLFDGPGEMRALCRAFDWSASPVGPVESWPHALRAAIRLCFDSGFPTVVHAGTRQVLIYNDACVAVLRAFGMHPRALGRTAREVWAHPWEQIAPMYAAVWAGEPVVFEDRPFVIDRGNGPEVSNWTCSVSAIRADDGTVVGIYSQAIETTHRVLAEQSLRTSEARQAFLLRLSDALRLISDPVAIQATATRLLGEHLRANRVCYVEMSETESVVHQDYVDGVRSIAGRWRNADFGKAMETALRSERTNVVSDIRALDGLSDEERANYAAIDVAAQIVVTLFKEGRWIANFGVHSASPREWTKLEVQLTEETAERTWGAVERARAEAALRVSEERRELALRASEMGAWDYDLVAGVCHFDARAQALYNLPSESLDHRPEGVAAVVHPDDLGPMFDAIQHASDVNGDGRYDIDYRIAQRDGQYRWLRAWGKTEFEGEGAARRAVRIVGASRDITLEKEAERHRERAQRLALEEVERLVRERTSERDALRRLLAAAEEEERRRLARELHDQLGQQLTAFRLGLEDAARLATEHNAGPHFADAPLLARIGQLQTLADSMTRGARYIALELRPPELDDVGLASALETYVREWGDRYRIAAELTVTTPSTQPLFDGPEHADVASALYRIAQESLTNVAKHAEATAVSIVVDRRNGEARLIIEDNGRGFDVEGLRSQSRHEQRRGLAGIRERAALLGGEVTIESSPDTGTTLYIRLPIRKPASHLDSATP